MNRALIAAALLLVGAALFAQVDRDELNKAQGTSVTFSNYVGPHSRIDTAEQIVGIGQGLGRQVKAVTGDFSAGKYRLIHVVGPAEGTKLDADIFILEASAEVDDVINIMRMVSGYLQAAYSYSPADAMLLARFIVYYNAVFRGNMQYLGGIYKTPVMRYVTAENAGIATRYTEWPGTTRMLVPLSIGAQKVGAGQLASEPVIQNLQEQPGKGLPERKDLTELQQREIDQNQQQLQQQQAQLEKDKQALAEQQKALAEAEAAGTATDQQRQAVAQQEQKVQQEQQAAAQTRAQVAADQQSVQEQRAVIATDEQALIQQQAAQQQTPAATGASAAPGKVLFLYAVAGGQDRLGKLVMIDRTSGKLLSQSDLNTVRGRTYVTLGGSIVVVAGSTGGNAAVRLVSVDPDTLVMKTQGKDNIALTSYIAASDTSAYAVLNTARGTFLGRFDASLALQAQSERAVDASTYIVISGTEVFVQDSAGNILIMDMNDLKEKKRNG